MTNDGKQGAKVSSALILAHGRRWHRRRYHLVVVLVLKDLVGSGARRRRWWRRRGGRRGNLRFVVITALRAGLLRARDGPRRGSGRWLRRPGRQRLRGLGLRAETQEAGHAAQLGVQITKDVPSLRWARGPIGAGEAVGMRDGQKADVVKGTRGGRAAAHLFAEHAAHHA